MRTLIPAPVVATARPMGRGERTYTSGWLPFGLTARALLLLAAGLVFTYPAFFHPERIWIMLAWDGLVAALVVLDAEKLPGAARLRVSRRFLDSPRLGDATRVELELTQDADVILDVRLIDELEPTLLPVVTPVRVRAYPRDAVRAVLTVYPGRRGDLTLGKIFLHSRGVLGLVERWAVAECGQPVRVYPAMDESGNGSEMYLVRARQIELEKRRLRQRGVGREFESLRDYTAGDELRNLSWTATARRGKLITRQYTVERSQQVWVVLDAGRLSRTAFALKRRAGRLRGESELEAGENLLLTVTQLDQAATAAVMLAETVGASADKCGLLTYGRGIQQQLLPGAGPSHLRTLIDQLSQVKGEAAEANHLRAASRLKHLQRRRGLVIWITELADSAGRPEIVSAVVELARRHVVLLVLLEHPELTALAERAVKTVEQMYETTAAKEMLDRRRGTIAELRQLGVLVVETPPGEVGMRAINSYLDVKARGLI